MKNCIICGNPILEERLTAYTIPPKTCSQECAKVNDRKNRAETVKRWRKSSKGAAYFKRQKAKRKGAAMPKGQAHEGKELGKLLDRGLDDLAVRIAQTAEKQGVPVWSMYVGRTDCPQWDRLVVALAEFLAIDGWPITDKDVAKLRRRKQLGKLIELESAAVDALGEGG